MTNPIPFTADPSDPNSPKGAIPVSIFGAAGEKGEKGEKGDPGTNGADGFPTEAQWDALVSRVEALENALDSANE